MIPGVWQSIVLVLAAFRATRLIGWDHLPPLVRARAWATGEHRVTRGSTNARLGQTSERVEEDVDYRWPTLAFLLHCAYCLGAYISLAWYAAWRLWPTWSLTVAAVFALSGAVGIVARWLDP